MRVREEYRGLNGTEKAAILLLSLGEDHVSRVFEHMDEEEIRALSSTMAQLGTVSATLVERLFQEFGERISSTGSLVGTFESTERLLTKVLGEDRVGSIMEEIRGLKFKKKKAASFGCYGWSGESVKMINELLDKSGFKIVNEGLKALWNPDEACIAECLSFGKELAEKMD